MSFAKSPRMQDFSREAKWTLRLELECTETTDSMPTTCNMNFKTNHPPGPQALPRAFGPMYLLLTNLKGPRKDGR